MTKCYALTKMKLVLDWSPHPSNHCQNLVLSEAIEILLQVYVKFIFCFKHSLFSFAERY